MFFNHGSNSFNCLLGSGYTCLCNIACNLKRMDSKIRVVTQPDKSAIYLKIWHVDIIGNR